MGHSDNYWHLLTKKSNDFVQSKKQQQHKNKKQNMQHAGNHHQIR
jgi:hypothetical protein